MEQLERDPFFGCTGDGSTETDWQFGGELVLPAPRNRFFPTKTQIQQTDVSPVSCTVISSTGAKIDLTSEYDSLDVQNELWNRAVELGANPKVGWDIKKAVELVGNRHNDNHPDDPIRYFQVEVGSDKYFEVQRKGYTVVEGYRGNKSFNADRDDNGILDLATFGISSYGHCNRTVYHQEPETTLTKVDNYPRSRPHTNLFKVEEENMKRLIDNNVFFRYGYFYVYEKDMKLAEQLKDIPVWGLAAVEEAKKFGISDWSNPHEIVASPVAEAMYYKSGHLTQLTGLGISKIRMAVLMYRLGAFKK